MTKEILCDKAKEAMKRAYAPYSNCTVGAALLAKSGKVDILVNNSALRCTKGFWSTEANLNESFAANATGLIMITRAFGDHMAQRGSGSIINIGSYMGEKDILMNKFELSEAMDAAGRKISNLFRDYEELSGRIYRKVEGYRYEYDYVLCSSSWNKQRAL